MIIQFAALLESHDGILGLPTVFKRAVQDQRSKTVVAADQALRELPLSLNPAIRHRHNRIAHYNLKTYQAPSQTTTPDFPYHIFDDAIDRILIVMQAIADAVDSPMFTKNQFALEMREGTYEMIQFVRWGAAYRRLHESLLGKRASQVDVIALFERMQEDFAT